MFWNINYFRALKNKTEPNPATGFNSKPLLHEMTKASGPTSLSLLRGEEIDRAVSQERDRTENEDTECVLSF